MITVNLDKVRARLAERKEKEANRKKSRDPKESDILKPLEAGNLRVRAVPYPHQDDPEGSPFLERSYHYGIPGAGVFFCPQENLAEPCHICEYVWGQKKLHKGDKEQQKEWDKYLPQIEVFIPVLARGRESEGPKFFRVRTYKNKMSQRLEKIYGWFMDEDYDDWMDPKKGRDIKLKYIDAPAGQAVRFAPIILSDMELSPKASVFSKEEDDYESFLGKIKNIDKELYPIKSTEDSLAVLVKWRSSFAKQAQENHTDDDDDDVVVSGENKKEKVNTQEADDNIMSDIDEKLEEIRNMIE